MFKENWKKCFLCLHSRFEERNPRRHSELTQHEGHGDEAGVVVAVDGQLLKTPPLALVQEKSKMKKKEGL